MENQGVDGVGEEMLTVGRNGYFHEYSYFAELYGSSARSIKRWVALGRAGKDPCPLDNPEKLRVWWARHFKKQCPDKILMAAVGVAKNGPPVSEAVEPSKVTVTGFTPRELKVVGDEEVGLDATLERLRFAEVQTNRMMIAALEAGDEGKANLAQSMWTKLTTQVRQVEKDARLESESRGLLIPKNYAEKSLIELHSSIERGMRGMYRRMCEVMRINIDAETEAAWNSECDRLFVRFREEVWK